MLTPRGESFSIPFEGVEHAATWMCWPFDDDEWRGCLDGARREMAGLIETLAEVERVELIAGHAEAEEDARRRFLPRLGHRLRLHSIPLNDVWFRDNGPIFLRRNAAEVAATVWSFNAWGGKYPHQHDARAARAVTSMLGILTFEGPLTLEGGALEVDGLGSGLSTVPCLLDGRRNPGLGRAQAEHILGDALGVENWTWLEHGLEGDHTDGHIDTLARYVTPGVVVVASCGEEDSNFNGLQENRRVLREAGLELVDLPIPAQSRYQGGVRVPETYVNYYLANGLVIVPQYGDRRDARALSILKECFPGRQVVGLSSTSIVSQGGSFHCLTQQQPAGALCASL